MKKWKWIGALMLLIGAGYLGFQQYKIYLPGIIGERFVSVLDLSKTDYIDLREFVHGFFKVYYSNLETKIKLSFDM
jgi:hypothetical protein